MVHVIFRHKVQDFKKWKPIYDEHGAARKKAGCKNEQLFRLSEDPNDLFILMEWDSIENVRTFSQSEELREKMRTAGVIGVPEIHFLEQIEKKVTGGGMEEAA